MAKPAILSLTLRFIAAGGLALVVAIAREITRPDTDWVQVVTMAAGLLVGMGGGAYGRLVATGPIKGLLQRPGGAQPK